MQTFGHTKFGMFGEQRLALEPTLLAVMLAGGVGAFIHYELPISARVSQIQGPSAVTEQPRNKIALAAVLAPALQIPVSFGNNATQLGKLQSPTAASRGEPDVSTATLLDKRPATSRSFLSLLNGSGSKQDYVIRLNFAGPAPENLVVVVKPSTADSSALVRDADLITETGPTTASLELIDDGIAADGTAALDPEEVIGIQTARLAELQAATAAELQGFAGLAALPLDGSKFDLAMLPKSAPRAAEPRTVTDKTNRGADANLAVKPRAASRTGLKLPSKQDRIVGEFIFHRTTVQLNDSPAGNLDVRIGGDTSLSIQVSALLSIVEGHMDPALFEAMSASAGATEFVSFSEIRAAGIDVRYDAAADQIVLTAD